MWDKLWLDLIYEFRVEEQCGLKWLIIVIDWSWRGVCISYVVLLEVCSPMA